MKKIDQTVWRETGNIALWAFILSAVTQAVFLVAGLWDYTVLLGNLLSLAAVILNFFLMALTVQRALHKEEKEAKQTMKLSSSLRLLFLFLIAAVGVALPVFSTWTVIIPLFFPRIAIALRMLVGRLRGRKEDVNEE